MIQIKSVTKKFPTITAVDNISLEIKEKEFFGLIGPNGAGKSTLMNLLVGYFNPDAGEISINNQKVSIDNLELRKSIGLVPQSLALYDDISAQENLEIFGSLFNIPKNILKEKIKDRLNSVELYERRKDKVRTFSGGMKRRLNMIASLLHDPTVLLCDEPTVGVDPQSRNAIFDFLINLNEQGKTIIYTTHYMEEAERLCSRIAIIDLGKIIAEGSVGELIHKLPYEQTILINKNQTTIHQTDLFKQFGDLIDEQDYFELKPNDGLVLSSFFAKLEKGGIEYQSIVLKKPSLEAVFLHLTGRRLRD
ncbi:MAG: ABC transporter ATP-binding protein [Ignavibacteriales bacterium]|nr:ABC transporter ATP-binding protein [Ignavibacteriales bacterium]